MRIPRLVVPLSLAALSTLSHLSSAQAPGMAPDLPAPATRGAAYDPQQFPAIRGEIERLSLTAHGDVDGVILKDGTEVIMSPELSTQIAFSIKPGDRVTIHGLRAAALPLVHAVSVTDDVTHRTVTDSDGSAPMTPPPAQPAPPPRGAASLTRGPGNETSGRVRMALHGPQGEVNGVLLDSGVILRFPPDQVGQLGSLIQPHAALVAEGTLATNTLGTVMEVRRLGAARDRLIAVGPSAPAGPSRVPGAPPPPPRRLSDE